MPEMHIHTDAHLLELNKIEVVHLKTNVEKVLPPPIVYEEPPAPLRPILSRATSRNSPTPSVAPTPV